MNLLVDATPLVSGGGVQVALSFVAQLLDQDEIIWTANFPHYLERVVGSTLGRHERISFFRRQRPFDRLWAASALRDFERRTCPDVVFTVFGPALFHAVAPHAVGFAQGLDLYRSDPSIRSPGILGRAAIEMRLHSFRQADHLIVETETARTRLSQVGKIDRRRISVIGNGLSPLFASQTVESSTEEGRFNVLVPAAPYWHKQLRLLPQIASALRARAPAMNFSFTLTVPRAHPEWTHIARCAEKLDVLDAFVSVGNRTPSELGQEYRRANAVLLPTLLEISTAVYPEAFHFQKPLVTSDKDFARELCGAAALFVNPSDHVGYADAIIQLAQNPSLRHALVTEGKKQLAQLYPSPREKFDLQIHLLKSLASTRAR